MTKLGLADFSQNLVAICDGIIERQLIDKKSSSMEYSNNGKKYRMTTNGQFIRVRVEDKHLVIAEHYESYKDNLSILSSYQILKAQGDVLQRYRNLCLAIIFFSREIELNKWYDETSSKVCTLQSSLLQPKEVEREALEYITGIDGALREEYIKLGAMISTATKINFFQSDHNVSSPTLDGYALKRLVTETCGVEALTSPDIYNSLRAFSHWCSIKGIFHCLDIPALKIDDLLIHNFKSFPTIPRWIKDTVKNRYPAGTSSCSIIKKTLILISQSVYGHLITIPSSLDTESFFALCNDIEHDPLRYHVRSTTLDLSIEPPVELHKVFKNAPEWIEFISCVLHGIGNIWFQSNMSTSNKILNINKVKNNQLFKNVSRIAKRLQTLDSTVMSSPDPEKLAVKLLGGPVFNSISSHLSNIKEAN